MSGFFRFDYAMQGEERQGRVIGPVDTKAFMQFVDAFREQGMAAATPLFPKEWEWYDGEGAARPVLDLVPVVVSGLILSDRAYHAMKRCFPEDSKPHVEVPLGGQLYHWLRVPIFKSSVGEVSTLPIANDISLITLLPGAIHVCRDQFAELWLSSGLTGAQITPLP